MKNQAKMAATATKVVIPFGPLLLQIAECLGFAPPKYTVLDDSTKKVAVCLKERADPYSEPPIHGKTHYYLGGQATSIGESCENASRQAVKDLMKKFNIVVKDITYFKQKRFEKCEALYKLKYTDLAYVEKGFEKPMFPIQASEEEVLECNAIVLDYIHVLDAVLAKLGIMSIQVETIEHDPEHFTTFLLLDLPSSEEVPIPIVGECCSTRFTAKNSMAMKAIEYLIAAHNLEIVDANYNSQESSFAPIACAMQRESFLTIKERVLGIREEVSSSCLLVEADCITPRGLSYKIHTINDPPLPPRKTQRCAAGASASFVPDTPGSVPVFFRIPAPLETVFKRTKRGD